MSSDNSTSRAPGGPGAAGPQPPVTCRNGHPLTPGAAFCPTCGAPTGAPSGDLGGGPGGSGGPPAEAPWANSPSGPSAGYPGPVGGPPGTKLSRKTIVALAAVAAAVVLGGAVLVAVLTVRDGADGEPQAAAPTTATVTGSMLLNDLRMNLTGCTEATTFYTDIAPGAPVVVKSETAAILGTASLGPGRKQGNRACVFDFSVPGVRTDATVYTVDVGTSGSLQKTRAQAVADNWRFDLKLGI